MDIAHIPGATRTIGEGQGYLGLPLRDEPVHCTVNGPATPSMVTAWLPTPDEVAALMAGAAVHVRILGTEHPPIMCGVGPAGEGPGDAPAPAQEPVAVPAGWKLVPVELTREMLRQIERGEQEGFGAVWSDVLAAAPVSPPAESGEVERSPLCDQIEALLDFNDHGALSSGKLPWLVRILLKRALAALASTPAPASPPADSGERRSQEFMSDKTRQFVEPVRKMLAEGINVQALGDATNQVIDGAFRSLVGHIDELEMDLAALRTAVALASTPAPQPGGAVKVKALEDALRAFITIAEAEHWENGHPFRAAALHHGSEALNMPALSPSPSGWDAGAEAPAAWRDVIAERQRQVSAEGWSPNHDDQQKNGALALAAACYARFAVFPEEGRKTTEMPEALTTGGRGIRGWGSLCDLWPWDRHFWKPSTRRRELVKAGALILAEIERLDRLPTQPAGEG